MRACAAQSGVSGSVRESGIVAGAVLLSVVSGGACHGKKESCSHELLREAA